MINQQKGYMALIMILIITATALIVAISVNLLGIEESRMSVTKNISSQGQYIADACLDEALIRMKEGLPLIGLVGDKQIGILRPDGNSLCGLNYRFNCDGCPDHWQCVSEEDNGAGVSAYRPGGDPALFGTDIYELADPNSPYGAVDNVKFCFEGRAILSPGRGQAILQFGGAYEEKGELIDLSGIAIEDCVDSTRDWLPDEIKDLKAGVYLITDWAINWGAAIADEVWVEITYIAASDITIDVGDGVCTIKIEDGATNEKNITVTAIIDSSFGQATKTIQAIVDVSNDNYIELTCKQEGDGCF